MKKAFLYVMLLFHLPLLYAEKKMKLYALCTPSHEVLRDKYFLPSIQDDFDIIIENVDQTCSSAQFMNKGWTKTTIQKVNLIIRAIHENWGEIFIFSDVDIQFFAPIKKIIIDLMKDNDLIMQKNCPDGVLCTGFFACIGNERTLALWTAVKSTMIKNKSQSDQISFNQCIKRHSKTNPYGVKWNYLPNIFFGAGTMSAYPGYNWTVGKTLNIPDSIVMHHANWTKGIKNKIAQLKFVKNSVAKSERYSQVI
jgi:hypothetical protein